MIRAAVPGDLPAIMALERETFPTDAWSEPLMAAELASPHGRYIVDEEAGRLVGYAGLRSPRGAADADIQTIAVSSRARGRGRGRMLLRELLSAAVANGARDVFLEVRADNPVARSLYASEGFVEVGIRPRYYQPDDVDAVVMQLGLAEWKSENRSDSRLIGANLPNSDRGSENGARENGARADGAWAGGAWAGGVCT